MTDDIEALKARVRELGDDNSYLRGEVEFWRTVAGHKDGEIGRLKAERLNTDRRIHYQRMALRQNWEIVEMRWKWQGPHYARQAIVRSLKMIRGLRDELSAARAAGIKTETGE